MKHIFLTLLLAFTGLTGTAQTAVDFTANDCNGISHNLFTELDNGKVIVLCWVMPCATCTGPALTTNNVVQSYQSSNPNTVFFYMCDDYANSSCSIINSWANTAGIPQSVTSLRFSNAGINMMDYNSTGMPKIVVIGGANHTVFYNINNTVNVSNLQSAINAALTATGISAVASNFTSLNAFPQPASESATIQFNLVTKTEINLELYNLESQLIKTIYSGMLASGENKFPVNVSDLSAGMYLVKLSAGKENKFINLLVAH